MLWSRLFIPRHIATSALLWWLKCPEKRGNEIPSQKGFLTEEILLLLCFPLKPRSSGLCWIWGFLTSNKWNMHFAQIQFPRHCTKIHRGVQHRRAGTRIISLKSTFKLSLLWKRMSLHLWKQGDLNSECRILSSRSSNCKIHLERAPGISWYTQG